ncbi:Lrp/AsnC ligand binding domain-containing protein [Dongia soli]|jgi:DNA-binding Lrp family transcriptional regulator|uniref:Lrp/AsnC ligand binding domain-containing protein n=1 Tax=Dongia soli TaxID=600628 RepID=A0ABU5EFX7_9PROT|nr:Lrp/AsnC ligand binding domain-containing protein [Dongia soli]MDY0885015.1 Lrp/AsnC ligand binding domain-containing protein [Dongia soli]
MRPIFILVKCEPGTAYEVAANALDTVEQVGEVYSISGIYDLLVKCNLPTEMDVGRFVTGQIQTLPNVKDTQTIITFNAFT